VIRKCALIWIIVTVCLAGCHEKHKARPCNGLSLQLDTPAGMIEYLQQQNLRDLESIELWQNEYGPGLKITTTHYEIYTTLLEPLMLQPVPAFMEAAYHGYNSQLPEPIETPTKFIVYLFVNRQQWEDFTKNFADDKAKLFLKIKAGAYYLNGACVTYNIGIERTFTALGHEGWHQFNNRCFNFQLPSWLDEGVATLFETHTTKQGQFYFEPAKNTYRIGILEKAMNNNMMIPLKELIATNPGEVLAIHEGDETEAIRIFLSQSYALVRFLREANYEKRLANYRRLLWDGMRGNWPLDKTSEKIAIDRNIPRTTGWNRSAGRLLFKQYIGNDFGQIEKEYLAFCRQIVYHNGLNTHN